MALQNLDISDTLIELGKFLKNDSEITEFCEENFSQELKVYVGDFTRKTIPTVKDCPYIVLTDFRKKEGQNIEFCNYGVTAFIGVSADEETFVDVDEPDEPDDPTDDTDDNSDNPTDDTDSGETTDDDTPDDTEPLPSVLMLDVFDVGCKFMTLIEDVFNDKAKRNRPLSRCETDGMYPLDSKHWVGKMELTWRIYQTLGTTYQEEL